MSEWLSSCIIRRRKSSVSVPDNGDWIKMAILQKTSYIILISCIAVAMISVSFPVVQKALLPVLGFTKEASKSTVAKIFNFKDASSKLDDPTVYSNIVMRRKEKPKEGNKLDVSAEAVAAMHLAMEMKAQGKKDKAMKLYRHAVALDPKHPDILTAYGEFIEEHEHDLLEADHLYKRALEISPRHTKALANRQRTLPLVDEIDQATFNRIDRKRDILYTIPENHPGLRRMKKESYFSHIYHTTAIEGNTFTKAQTRAFVETRIAIGGKSIFEHNEILGMDEALNFINNTLLHRIGAITLEDILDIHRRVLGFVDPMEAGKLRDTQVFVGDFVPPAAPDLPHLMTEFINWLNDEETLNLHPIELAALAHYKLVVIHPFYDGNGRTSRLLMNLVLMQAGFPPVIIKVEDKHEYYKCLEAGNDGDIRPFIRFIAKCTEQTVDVFLQASTSLGNFTGIEGVLDDGRTIVVDSSDADEDPSEE